MSEEEEEEEEERSSRRPEGGGAGREGTGKVESGPVGLGRTGPFTQREEVGQKGMDLT